MTKSFNIGAICCILAVATVASALPRVQIVDGEDAERREFPYQIRFTSGNTNHTMCSGVLVVVEDKQFSLTTASCARAMYDFFGIKMFVGELHVNEISDGVQFRIPNRAIIADDYDENKVIGNLAIVGYEQPFNLTADVQPISLPLQGQNTTGNVLISGWGFVDDWVWPDTLQKLQLSIISDELCRDRYTDDWRFTPQPSMLCAERREGGGAHCNGDIGGPVKALEGGYLAGIMSYPQYCPSGKSTDHPDVYTEIAYYVDWIKLKAKDL